MCRSWWAHMHQQTSKNAIHNITFNNMLGTIEAVLAIYHMNYINEQIFSSLGIKIMHILPL